MYSEVSYCTGLSGFIGKNLLPILLRKYSQVINFRRNNTFEIYKTDGSIQRIENNKFQNVKGEKIFINIAALYNQNPENLSDLSDLYESNAVLPIKIIEELIGSDQLKIIQISSYFQLLDFEFQTPYSLTKSLATKYIKQNYKNSSFVYLFDTFGSNDNRNKVIDTFIKRILKKMPIQIPKSEVLINISHVEDVCEAIVNCLNLPAMDYCVMSKNTLSLRQIAFEIMNILESKVEIQEFNSNQNYLSNLKIDQLPKNLFTTLKNKNFREQLLSRIKEIEELSL